MFHPAAGQVVGFIPLGLSVVFAPLVFLLVVSFATSRPTARGAGMLHWSIVALLGASRRSAVRSAVRSGSPPRIGCWRLRSRA
mgnify:CR=1 FL=1|jgi:hypothetical protein